MNKRMQPNWHQARVFIAKIAGHADPKMTFQVFDDKGDSFTLAAWKHGRLSEPAVRTFLQSKAEQGCGIFVTISACDGSGRRRKNVRYARACFIDLDGEPLPDDSDWKIKPDVIVESSPAKYHCYWLIQKLEDLNLFSDTQAMLAARFSADPRVFDPSRVLRVPGFFHQKGKPFRSHVMYMSDRAEWDRLEITELRIAYPADYVAPTARAEDGRSDEPENGWDAPADVVRAEDYLRTVDPPTQGDRNNQAYRVAARLNDFGISAELSLNLLADIWNKRLESPLAYHELQHVANNAGLYKASSAGIASLANQVSAKDEFDDLSEVPDERNFQAVPKLKESEMLIRPEKTIRHTLNGMSYSCMDEIRAEPLTWLWPGRIPRGKVTIIAGYPDQGKSQIMLKCAAIVSNGADWPNDEGKCAQGCAIILSSEDDEADTLKPRAAAAGANMKNMYVIRSMVTEVREGARSRRVFNIEDDLAKLTQMVKELGGKGQIVRFIGIDPINAYFGGPRKGDSHKTADMRALLTPLAEWAARTKIAIVCISHFNKGTNSHTLYRITDSSAITAAARSVHVAVRTNADKHGDRPQRIFAPIKHNLAKDTIKALSYEMEAKDVSEITGVPDQIMPYVEFGSPSELTAEDALGGLSKPGPRNTATQECRDAALEWFNDPELLEDGAITTKRLKALCGERGLAWRTMVRTLPSINVIHRNKQGSFPREVEWFQASGDVPAGEFDDSASDTGQHFDFG